MVDFLPGGACGFLELGRPRASCATGNQQVFPLSLVMLVAMGMAGEQGNCLGRAEESVKERALYVLAALHPGAPRVGRVMSEDEYCTNLLGSIDLGRLSFRPPPPLGLRWA